jgi:hypothetical protein
LTRNVPAPDGTPLATDEDPSNGLFVEWDANEPGIYYVSVRATGATQPELATTPCDPTSASACPPGADYRLDVISRPIVNPIEGPSEQEPNDSIDTANSLLMRQFPTPTPGAVVRGGAAHGIAGGPTADEDYYEFEVRAGEHVDVHVRGLVRDIIPRPLEVWLHDQNLNEYGDPAGTVYRRGGPKVANRIEHILAKHPALDLGRFEVTVYDAAGNEVGTSASVHPGSVSFDAPSDGTYYALVRASATASSTAAGHYRLGVLARSQSDEIPPDPVAPGARAVVQLDAGKSLSYFDDSGDRVLVSLGGRSGQATITFSEATPDGSDIVSVEIAGVRKGGSFTVQTDGTAEVGSIAIQGTGTATRKKGNARSGNFDAIQVAGNVGIVSSGMNVRSLVIDGMLGDLAAAGQQIRELRAVAFDSALAEAGSIRTLVVERESSESLLNQFLPWEPPAEF